MAVVRKPTTTTTTGVATVSTARARAESRPIDLAVIGGGPAGLAAAIEAARLGASVTVFDEQSAPGGQLFKQIHKFFGSSEHQAGVRGFEIGRRLLREAADLGVDIRLGAAVYAVYPGPRGPEDDPEEKTFPPRIRLEAVVDGRSRSYSASRLLIATGASENALAFPGWTLPGVMGAGAAQTMVNTNRVLPGRRILMVGSGNVGLIVSYQLLQAGAEVAAVVEALPRVGGYQVHANKLRRAGVPFFLGHTVLEALGRDRVEGVRVGRLGPDGRPLSGTGDEIMVDTVCLAVGLNPLTELLGVLGARRAYLPELGGHVPVHDENMRTSLPGVYVAGDVTGVEEASSAMEEGRLAGVAAAESLGLVDPARAASLKDAIRERLDALRSGPFGLGRRQAKARQVQKAGWTDAAGEVAGGSAPPAPSAAVRADADALPPPVLPSEVRLARGPVAIIDCPQEIPCNPCEAACPSGAITVGRPITRRPVLDQDLCTGCGLCVTSCPGLAIVVADGRPRPQGGPDRPGPPETGQAQLGRVSFPHEYLPLPERGQKVTVIDAEGCPVGEAEVIAVRLTGKADHTPVVTVSVPLEQVTRVRGMRKL